MVVMVVVVFDLDDVHVTLYCIVLSSCKRRLNCDDCLDYGKLSRLFCAALCI